MLYALVGLLFLVASVVLELLRRRGMRRRGDNDMCIAPDQVRNIST